MLDLPLETVIGSICDPTEFQGLPEIVKDEEGASVFALPPAWAKRLFKAKKGILFLDELTDASPSVQAGMLRVVLEGRVGDLSLPVDVVRIAACNPPEQAANGHEISLPLRNRFLIYEHTHDVSQWCDGFMADWPDPVVDKLPEDWQDNLVKARTFVTSYIRKTNPGGLLDMPTLDTDALSAYATPRSWDKAATILAALISTERFGSFLKKEPQSLSLFLSLVGGLVGRQAGPFLSWLADMDLPGAQDLLDNPTLLPEDRDDKRFICLQSVVQLVLRNTNDKDFTTDYWTPALDLCMYAHQKGYIDVAATTAFQILSLVGKIFDPDRYPLPDNFEVFNELYAGMKRT